MKQISQIFVVGMHRSGTSALARILNLMGAYFGPDNLSLGSSKENPKGFWERQDVRDINDAVLSSLAADWQQIGKFELSEISTETHEQFKQHALPILEELDAHGTWMLKEPRICLLYPLWENLTTNPLCIHMQRSPLEVALSLKTRNGHSLTLAAALWEKYNLRAFKNSQTSPRVLLSHQQLMADPVETVNQLFEELQQLGVANIQKPSDLEISSFIDPALYRSKGDLQTENAILNDEQRHLRDLIDSGKILRLDKLPALSPAAEDTLLTFDATQSEKEAHEFSIQELETERAHLMDKNLSAQKKSTKEILYLQRLLETANEASHKLTSSNRWKLGNLLSFKTKKQSDGSIPYPPLSDVFDRFDTWKKNNP